MTSTIDSEFDIHAKHVERQLAYLRSSIAAFAKLASRMDGDDSIMRRSIRSASHEIQSASSSIENDMNSLAYIERHSVAQIQGQRRLRQNRLLRDLNSLKKQFKAAKDNVKLFEHREALSSIEGEQCRELQSLLDRDCDEIVLVGEDAEIDRDLERERDDNLSLISKKVSLVQEAFQNFANMTAEQGELLDDIESCVRSTRDDTQKAMIDLNEAAASRSCNALYIAFAVLAVFSLYLVAI